MLKFIKSFLLFIILYHLLVTVICYGFLGGQYQEIFSLVRDGVWIAFIIFVVVKYRKECKEFCVTRRYPLISFSVLLVFGIGISQWIGKGRYDIFIGIKYGVWYLWILLSAVLVGHDLAFKKEGIGLEKFLRSAIYVLVVVVAVGFLRQGAKLVRPDFFTWIGYGPLDDFAYGVKPPLYYLTGYEGTLRRQGIFSGPNNYGYFLVAFLSVIILLFKSKITSLKNIFKNKASLLGLLVIALWIGAIIMTLSRSAIIGTVVVLAFVCRSWIKKHRKLSIGFLVLCVLGLVGLSLLKDTSTLAHITNKFASLQYVIDKPLGYGLGSSGPAVHYNGTILPENYFIQLMIDIGTVGFLIWCAVIWFVLKIVKSITTAQRDTNNILIYRMRKGLTIGRVALLVMGLFLHVFEDSMVNYLFFILRGITTGYLSYGLKAVKLGVWDFWKPLK